MAISTTSPHVSPRPETSAAAGPPPRVAVVIPVYRQPAFMVEAVASVLGQAASFEIAAVIVDDGCPSPETAILGVSLAVAHPSVTYLKRRNGGLSAARNTGIAHVLATWPSVEAVYFLDADNRLSPGAIASAFAILQSDPEIGWVYPHIDRFGIAQASNHAGAYSRLLHIAFDNISEAGSLVSRQVFERGLRFDESFAQGCEDWDFWLQCLDHGFVGRNDPLSGFEYRRRPQSMISATKRDFPLIRERLRGKHPELNAYASLMALEHSEAPRFCRIDPESGAGIAFSDPAVTARDISGPELLRLALAGLAEPESGGLPPHLLWMKEPAFACIREFRLHWTLFNLVEKQLATFDFIALVLEHHDAELGFGFAASDLDTALNAPLHGFALTSTGLAALTREGLTPDERRGTAAAELKGLRLTLRGPFGRSALAGFGFVAAEPLSRWIYAWPQTPTPRWNWREPHFPTMPERARLIEKHLGIERPLCRIRRNNRPQIAIALPFVAYGGVERVSFALAEELTRGGCDVHLFIFGRTAMPLQRNEKLAFASINVFAEPGYAFWGGSGVYLGEDVRLQQEPAALTPRILGFLAGMDVVINCHVAGLNAAAGELQRHGVRVVSHLHVIDQTEFGRPNGIPYAALAYEHGHDAFLTCSEQLAAWLRGMGAPSDKILVIPNASAPASSASEPARKPQATANRELTVLFMGRLDHQKGIERLIAIVQGARRDGIALRWRVIGSSVIRRGGDAHWHQAFRHLDITVEPPILDPERVSKALASADILVMPSRWEGAPLTIIEAQRAGCVPIVTDVGAVSELIATGRDGLIVPDGDEEIVAAGFVSRIAELAQTPDRLAVLSSAAIQRAESRNWAQSCAPLLALLQSWFPHLRQPAERNAAPT